MSEVTTEIEAPAFLMATPQVVDPFFNHSVVLLLAHNEEGSFGFNLNRPTTVSISEVLEGLEIPWGGDPDLPAYFGGPVQPQLGTILFDKDPNQLSSKSEPEETANEIHPGLWMTQHVDDLAKLAPSPPHQLRLYLGYAGWGAGQLIDEILRNDWILGPVIDQLVFAEEPDNVWELALQAAGVDPCALPSWTPSEDGSSAN